MRTFGGMVILILGIIIMSIFMIIQRRKEKQNLGKEIVVIGTMLYFLLVIVITFSNMGEEELLYGMSISLVPFKESASMLKNNLENGIFQIVGNIIMLLPVGILLPLMFEKFRKFKNIFWIGIVFTFVIEISQMVLGRVFDIDDLIYNIFGVILGYGIYKLVIIKKEYKDISEKLLIEKGFKKVILPFLISMMVIVYILSFINLKINLKMNYITEDLALEKLTENGFGVKLEEHFMFEGFDEKVVLLEGKDGVLKVGGYPISRKYIHPDNVWESVLDQTKLTVVREGEDVVDVSPISIMEDDKYKVKYLDIIGRLKKDRLIEIKVNEHKIKYEGKEGHFIERIDVSNLKLEYDTPKVEFKN